MLSMHSILSDRRLQWLGHVHRMGPERIPRALLYGELATGVRKRGRPCLRYKDICKKDMYLVCIDHKTWESIAEERTLWRSKVPEGIQVVEATLTAKSEEPGERERGEEEQESTPSSPVDGWMPYIYVSI